MIYAIADIHGQYDRYLALLKEIRFGAADTLFVLGDVIDRGPQGMDILRDMMLRPNVYPILGNHEYMAALTLPWLLQEVTEDSVNRIASDRLQGLTEWMSVGGTASIEEFRRLSPEERQDILEYLSEFSLYDTVDAGGNRFVLVHAGLDHFAADRPLDDYDVSEVLFHSPDYERLYFPDRFLVTGHRPTRTIYAAEQGISLDALPPAQYQDRIFRKNHHIAIDCGAGFGGKLACLCLDTLEAYYV